MEILIFESYIFSDEKLVSYNLFCLFRRNYAQWSLDNYYDIVIN